MVRGNEDRLKMFGTRSHRTQQQQASASVGESGSHIIQQGRPSNLAIGNSRYGAGSRVICSDNNIADLPNGCEDNDRSRATTKATDRRPPPQDGPGGGAISTLPMSDYKREFETKAFGPSSQTNVYRDSGAPRKRGVEDEEEEKSNKAEPDDWDSDLFEADRVAPTSNKDSSSINSDEKKMASTKASTTFATFGSVVQSTSSGSADLVGSSIRDDRAKTGAFGAQKQSLPQGRQSSIAKLWPSSSILDSIRTNKAAGGNLVAGRHAFGSTSTRSLFGRPSRAIKKPSTKPPPASHWGADTSLLSSHFPSPGGTGPVVTMNTSDAASPVVSSDTISRKIAVHVSRKNRGYEEEREEECCNEDESKCSAPPNCSLPNSVSQLSFQKPQLRVTGSKQESCNNGGSMGTCMLMCPEEERLLRGDKDEIHLLEQLNSEEIHPAGWTSRCTAMKLICGSDADPNIIRPPPVLERCIAYLEEWVMERDRQGPDSRYGNSTPPSLDVYQFVLDSVRAIRNDLVLQKYGSMRGPCSASAVRCLERIVRWLVMMSHQLSHISQYVLQHKKENMEELKKTLELLMHCYNDPKGRSTVEENGADNIFHGCQHDVVMGNNPVDYDGTVLDNSSNAAPSRIIGQNSGNAISGTAEAEMRGLYILLFLSSHGNGVDAIKFVSGLRPEIGNSQLVQLALSAVQAKKDNNYFRFFSVLRDVDTPYLFACAMFKDVAEVRITAMQTMASAYGGYRKGGEENVFDKYPLLKLADLLCFETAAEVRDACQHHNITVVRGDDNGTYGGEWIEWKKPLVNALVVGPGQGNFNADVAPLQTLKMTKTIEKKRNNATRLAVCRGQVSGQDVPFQRTAPAVVPSTITSEAPALLGGSFSPDLSAPTPADLFYQLGNLMGKRIDTSARVSEALGREFFSQEQQRTATDQLLLGALPPENNLTLFKLAIVVPSLGGPSKDLYDTLYKWIFSRFVFEKIVSSSQSMRGKAAEVRSLVVPIRSSTDTIEGCDSAILVIPPFDILRRDECISFISNQALSLSQNHVPFVCLNLDDGSDRGYTSMIQDLNLGSSLVANLAPTSWVVDSLDSSLLASFNVVSSRFAKSQVVYGKLFGIRRIPLTKLGRLCLLEALRSHAHLLSQGKAIVKESLVLRVLHETISCLVLELDGTVTQLRKTKLSVWPRRDFAVTSGCSSVVENYWGDGSALPLNWLGRLYGPASSAPLDAKNIRSFLFQTFEVYRTSGVIRNITKTLLKNAPLDIREACKELVWDSNYLQAVKKVLIWQEDACQSSDEIIYLPHDEVIGVMNRVIDRVSLSFSHILDDIAPALTDVTTAPSSLSNNGPYKLRGGGLFAISTKTSRPVSDINWKENTWEPSLFSSHLSHLQPTPSKKRCAEKSVAGSKSKRRRKREVQSNQSNDVAQSKLFSAHLDEVFRNGDNGGSVSLEQDHPSALLFVPVPNAASRNKKRRLEGIAGMNSPTKRARIHKFVF